MTQHEPKQRRIIEAPGPNGEKRSPENQQINASASLIGLQRTGNSSERGMRRISWESRNRRRFISPGVRTRSSRRKDGDSEQFWLRVWDFPRSASSPSMEAVVVDAGSKLLKAGFASPDQDPALIMPTKMKHVVEDGDGGDASMIEEVTVDPVVRGFIRDWDAMEDLLRHVPYTDLGWEVGDEGQILFAKPLFTPKAIREQLVQLMFETFNVSGFYASEQAVLSLYAVGRISGCTVDIGHGKIDIAPVCEGAVQHIASKRFQIGGIDLTN
ncbi:Actin-related protein [Musa troglodytarum]|uniref:Actin-related protein n=2 Tax=Musa troglodytarum TaxID=320322 RepID=A0A9E7HNG5_9LILI|nr:Actin-related protein [Musa troglodytarum]